MPSPGEKPINENAGDGTFPEFSAESQAKYGDFVILTDGQLPRGAQAEEPPRK
jgi:hypothetical protein